MPEDQPPPIRDRQPTLGRLDSMNLERVFESLRAGTLPGLAENDSALATPSARADLALLVETALRSATERADGPCCLLYTQLLEILEGGPESSEMSRKTRPVLRLLEAIARLGEHLEDTDLWQAALVRLVDAQPEGRARVTARDRYAQFLFDRQGEISLSVDNWKQAAREAAFHPQLLDLERSLWQKALSAEAEDREAAEGLVRCCLQVNDWSPIPNAFPVLLHQIETPSDLAQYSGLLLELQPLAARSGAALEYSTLLDEVLWSASSESGAPVLELLRAKARVLAAHPTTSAEAADAYQALLESSHDPSDLAEYTQFLGQNPDLEWQRERFARLFDWRIGQEANPEQLLLEWASLEETHFGDSEASRALVERVLTDNPKSELALRQLVRLCTLAEDHAGAEDALCRLVDVIAPSERTEVQLLRADLLLTQLRQPDQAMELLAEVSAAGISSPRLEAQLKILLDDPNASLALSAARLLLATVPDRDLTAEDVERVLSIHQASHRIDPTTDGTLESFEALALRRSGFERLLTHWTLDPRMGLDIASAAVRQHPAVELFWDRLDALGLRAARPEQVVSDYHTVLTQTADRALAEGLGRRLLGFAESASVDPDALLAPLMRVLELVPQSRWALDHVKLRLGAQGQWSELLRLYDAALAALPEPSDRVALLTEAAVTAKDLAGDGLRAIGYYEELSQLVPGDPRVESSLERLYERHNLLDRHIAHLTSRLDLWQGLELQRVLQRLAVLCITANQPRQAWDAVQKGLLVDANWPPAVELLERLLVMPSARAMEGAPSVAELAGNLLCEHFAHHELHTELVRVLRELLSFVGDPRRRISLKEELAATLELRLVDPGSAFDIMSGLLAADPDNPDYRVAIARLADAPMNQRRYVDVLWDAAARTQTLEGRAALLTDAGYWCREILHDPARALDIYQRLADSAGDWTELTLSALVTQDELLSELDRPADRCAVAERLAALFPEPPKRVSAYRSAARLAAQTLADPARAARNWSHLLGLIPTDQEALDGLVDALTCLGDHPGLARALELRIAALGEGRESYRDRLQLARLCLDSLGAPERGLELFTDLHLRDPSDALVEQELLAALEHQGHWTELVRLLEASLVETRRPAPIHRRLAEIHREHTHDQRALVMALLGAEDPHAASQILASSTDPALDDVPLVLELSDMLLTAAMVDDAEAVLLGQLARFGDRKPRERGVVHERLGRVLLTRGDRQQALSEFELAVLIDPGNPSLLEQKGRLAFELGALDSAEKSFRGLLLLALHHDPGQPEVPARSRLYFELSRIAAARQDQDGANELIASAFDSTLGDEREILALENALLEHEQDELLLRVLDRRLETAVEVGEASRALSAFVARRMAHGSLSGSMLARLRDRADRLCITLQESTSAAVVWDGHHDLVALYRVLGDTECILTLLLSLCDRFADSDVGFELEVEAARLMLEQPERHTEGIDRLLAVWQRCPTRDDLARTLMEVLTEEGRSDELVGLLEHRIAASVHIGELEQADALSLRLADLLRRRGDGEAAARLCRSVVAHKGSESRRALALLAEILEASLPANAERLLEVLEALREASSGTEAALLGARLARVLLLVGDTAAAKRALIDAHTADPQDANVREALIRAQLAAGELDEATTLVNQGLAEQPQDLALGLLRAEVLMRHDRRKEALEVVEELGSHHPSDPRVMSTTLELLLELGETERALRYISGLETEEHAAPATLAHLLLDRGLDLLDPGWLRVVIELLDHGGEEQLALELLAERRSTSPDPRWIDEQRVQLARRGAPRKILVEALLDLLSTASDAELSPLAIELVRNCEEPQELAQVQPYVVRALAVDPTDRALFECFELTHAEGTDPQGFATGCLVAAKAEPESARRIALLERATATLLELGRPEEALEALTSIVVQGPALRLVIRRAECLALLGATHEAIGALDAVVHDPHLLRDPDLFFALRLLAVLHLGLDELVEAFEALAQAHRVDRSHLLTAFELGLLAVDLDEIPTAMTVLRLVTTTAKANENLGGLTSDQYLASLVELARLHAQKGNHLQARQLLARAAEENPHHPLVERLLGAE